MSLQRLLTELRNNAVDYKALAKHCVVLNAPPTERDISVVIGCRGRQEHLRTTLRYLNQAIAQTSLRVGVVVVEHDAESHFSPLAQENNAQYIFVDARHTGTGQEYSRSLAFNLGYAWAPTATWQLQHDSDLLMAPRFFDNLVPLMRNDVNFIQPYSERRVRMMSESKTKEILRSSTLVNLETVNEYRLFDQGAAGGSLLVRSSAFEFVGGYNCSFYKGYAPEDADLWKRLECLEGEIDNSYAPHSGYGTYCNSNTLWHLDHGTQHWTYSQQLEKMQNLYAAFCSLPYSQKLEFIKVKAELFAKQLE